MGINDTARKRRELGQRQIAMSQRIKDLTGQDIPGCWMGRNQVDRFEKLSDNELVDVLCVSNMVDNKTAETAAEDLRPRGKVIPPKPTLRSIWGRMSHREHAVLVAATITNLGVAAVCSKIRVKYIPLNELRKIWVLTLLGIIARVLFRTTVSQVVDRIKENGEN